MDENSLKTREVGFITGDGCGCTFTFFRRRKPQVPSAVSANGPNDSMVLSEQQQLLRQVQTVNSGCLQSTTASNLSREASSSGAEPPQRKAHDSEAAYLLQASLACSKVTAEDSHDHQRQKVVMQHSAKNSYKSRPDNFQAVPYNFYSDAEAQYSCGVIASNGIEGLDDFLDSSTRCFFTPDPNNSLHLYEQAASLGHPSAQTRLGYRYLTGSGVERNVERALYWLSKATQQEHESAELLLGIFFDNGLGLKGEQNGELARYWYEKAVAKKNAEAQFRLANLLSSHYLSCTPLMFELYTQAANQGHPVAQYELGERYRLGRGVEKDLERAAYWLDQAAEHEYMPAQYQYGRLYMDKEEDAVAANRPIRAEDKIFSQEITADLMLKLSRFQLDPMQYHTLVQDRTWPDVADTMFRVGCSREEALGKMRSTSLAYYFYQKAAKMGHSDASARLLFVRAE